jgi:polyhydroxyalkanoate synthesis repressor PhaR
MLVKKYGNRRLYDTEDSRYVRLAELAEKIRRGSDVRVIDATTGADLTAETLVQIIFEDRHAARMLPVTLLSQMIRMGDDALAEFLGRYVTWALEIYLHAKQGMGMGGLGSVLGAMSPFSAFAPFVPPFGAPRTASPPSPASREDAVPPAVVEGATRDEVAEIRKELEGLKRSLKKRPK